MGPGCDRSGLAAHRGHRDHTCPTQAQARGDLRRWRSQLAAANIAVIESRPREEASQRQERAWIRAAQGGSEEAFERLFRLHWHSAYRGAYLVVHDAAAAEDIAQEAFLAAIRALDRFDRRRPFGPWLHRIVVNRAIDWGRARSLRRETAPADELPDPGDARAEPGANPYPDEVESALLSLSPEHRAVVVLRYLLEYTPGEIAKMLSLPRGTVNSRLRRGLDRLQEYLEEEPR